MLKATIQALARRLGYRIVPRDRDAQTLYDEIRTTQFRTIIDVGANTGLTVKKWLNDFPTAHIHAVEPLKSAFAKLKTLEQASEHRVSAWNFAASDHVGEDTFFVHTDHPTSSSILRATSFSAAALPFTMAQKPEKVEVCPIDEFFAARQIEFTPPIMIKLDVQGVEAQVLAGAAETLVNTKIVLTEVSLAPLYENQTSFATVFEILTRKNFQFAGFLEQFHLKDGTAAYVDAVFRK